MASTTEKPLRGMMRTCWMRSCSVRTVISNPDEMGTQRGYAKGLGGVDQQVASLRLLLVAWDAGPIQELRRVRLPSPQRLVVAGPGRADLLEHPLGHLAGQ